MSKRSSVVSRNFFRRPIVRELVPNLKLLLVVLTTGCESTVGCFIPSGLCEDSGLETAAVDGGLADLERGGHIMSDAQTGEVFLLSFFRDNTFKGEPRTRVARDDFRLIASEKLKARVLVAVEQSPECGLEKSVLEPKTLCNAENQELAAQGKEKKVKEIELPPKPPSIEVNKKSPSQSIGEGGGNGGGFSDALAVRIAATIEARQKTDDPVKTPPAWSAWVMTLPIDQKNAALEPGDLLLKQRAASVEAQQRLDSARRAPVKMENAAIPTGVLAEAVSRAEQSRAKAMARRCEE